MMQVRMKNPATILPDATKALQALNPAVQNGGAPAQTLALVHLRASQINGCSFCVDYGVKHAKQAGETDERLVAVSA
jgi:AhpD family alkylhydroperoxidase